MTERTPSPSTEERAVYVLRHRFDLSPDTHKAIDTFFEPTGNKPIVHLGAYGTKRVVLDAVEHHDGHYRKAREDLEAKFVRGHRHIQLGMVWSGRNGNINKHYQSPIGFHELSNGNTAIALQTRYPINFDQLLEPLELHQFDADPFLKPYAIHQPPKGSNFITMQVAGAKLIGKSTDRNNLIRAFYQEVSSPQTSYNYYATPLEIVGENSQEHVPIRPLRLPKFLYDDIFGNPPSEVA